MDSLEVNGKRPPDSFLHELRQQNLAKDAYKNPRERRDDPPVREPGDQGRQDHPQTAHAREAAADTDKRDSPEPPAPVPEAVPADACQGRGSSRRDTLGPEVLASQTADASPRSCTVERLACLQPDSSRGPDYMYLMRSPYEGPVSFSPWSWLSPRPRRALVLLPRRAARRGSAAQEGGLGRGDHRVPA